MIRSPLKAGARIMMQVIPSVCNMHVFSISKMNCRFSSQIQIRHANFLYQIKKWLKRRQFLQNIISCECRTAESCLDASHCRANFIELEVTITNQVPEQTVRPTFCNNPYYFLWHDLVAKSTSWHPILWLTCCKHIEEKTKWDF